MSLGCEDKVEIQELTVRYAYAMDSEDAEAWLSTWADDGIWEGGLGKYEGKSALARLLTDLGDRIRNKRHVMTNFVISGDGEEATQQCYMLVYDRVTSPSLVATGVYTDVLSKVDGCWKFTHRKVKLDPSFHP